MPGALDEYEVICPIGEGSYGTCKKIKRKKDGRILVWKKMDYGEMDDTEKEMLVSEVNLLRELKHKRIVRYYDRIVDRVNTCLYIIMEYCEGGDLLTYIKSLKTQGGHAEEDFVWKMCIQIIQALKECHDRNKLGKAVLHRDLKPANVFLDAHKNVKLGDFGLARVLSHDTSFAKTFVGTPYYMSPEQMNYMSYNEKSDIWSLGCLLYELCSLRPPFLAKNQKDLAEKICCGNFSRLPIRYSRDLNSVIAYMLQVEGSKRPSIDDLLVHPLIIHKIPLYDPDSKRSERRSFGSSDGDSLRQRDERLKEREEILRQKEEVIRKREKNLDERELKINALELQLKSQERSLVLKEKNAKDLASRAEKLMKEYTHTKLRHHRISESGDCDLASDSDQSGIANTPNPPPCIWKPSSRPSSSPPKRVSFSPQNKENIFRDPPPIPERRERRPSKKSLLNLNLEERFNAAADPATQRRASLYRYPLLSGDR